MFGQRQYFVFVGDDAMINAIEKNAKIDRELEEERHKRRKIIKLLLLGAAESGKSTILKQVR